MRLYLPGDATERSVRYIATIAPAGDARSAPLMFWKAIPVLPLFWERRRARNIRPWRRL